MSLFATIAIWIAVKLKIKLRTLIILGFAGIAIFMAYSTVIFYKMEKKLDNKG